MLDGDLELEGRSRFAVLGLHVAEREIPLEQRRPGAARGVAHLFTTSIYRRAGAPRDVGDVRRESALEMQLLEGFPAHVEADEAPCGSARLFLAERALSVERSLRVAHCPSEVELVGRRPLILDECVLRREVVDVEHHEPCLDARDVERPYSRRDNAVRSAGTDQCVPGSDGA